MSPSATSGSAPSQSSAAAVASGVAAASPVALRSFSAEVWGAHPASHGPHGGHGAKAEEVAAVHLHRFFAHSPSCIVDLSCVDERCDWPSQCVIMEELRDRGHRLRAVIREITSLR